MVNSVIQSEATESSIKSKVTPLVTVITPTYNRADYLEETIESVLSQDYANLEYIVLDDGSTDNTREILERYTGKLVWQSHTNMGEVRTVNKAYKMAKGDFIAVVNSDDPLLPDAISQIVDEFSKHPEALVVYPDWQYIDDKGEFMASVETPDYDFLEMLSIHKCMPGPGTFIRKEALTLTGLRDPSVKYISDFDFWLRMGLKGPFKRLPKVLASYRVHATSLTSTGKGRAMSDEDIELVDRIYRSKDMPAAARKLKRRAYSWAHYHACQVAGNARFVAAWHALLAILYEPAAFRGPSYQYKRNVVARIFRNLLPEALKNPA